MVSARLERDQPAASRRAGFTVSTLMINNAPAIPPSVRITPHGRVGAGSGPKRCTDSGVTITCGMPVDAADPVRLLVQVEAIRQ